LPEDPIANTPAPPEIADSHTAAQAPAFTVVGVGASAGGLEAFTQLLQHLPPQPGVALVLVQHLDPKRESLLTSILSQATPLSVREALEGMQVERDHVYVIPPNTYISISGGALALQPRNDTPGPNMPIDHFFRSLAADLESRAVGVILSGGGSDGTLGLEAIKAAGGIVFAQTESTARHASMPHSAISSGCVDIILPPDGIARELARINVHPYVTAPPGAESDEALKKNNEHLVRLYALLRERTGVDFTHYKQSTIRRRIHRQMALNEVSDIGELVRLVKEKPDKLDRLFQDFLIRVTSFFRDPAVFEALSKQVFPALIRDRFHEGPIRIWVPGCSTGEEAYSLAISLLEFLGDMANNTPIKILATDINEAVLAKARAGLYLENISADVSPERLRRFFQKADGSYRISKSVRDLCVFARHNVFSDPPFANLDLISCRNALIYLSASLQRRVVPLFHYALKPNGFLLLGPSETVSGFTDRFSPVDREARIYLRSLTQHRLPPPYQESEPDAVRPGDAPTAAGAGESASLLDIQREADRVQLKYAPAGVLIDQSLTILQFRGDTSRFLRHAPGMASLELLRLAREGLLTELRDAIKNAQAQNLAIRKEGVHFRVDDQLETVTLQVIPLRGGPVGQRCFLVLFEEPDLPQRATKTRTPAPGAEADAAAQESVESLHLIQQELNANREHLQSVIEEYEATNEELKSANEEILASNEELQSTNEELQTTKEEMQSTNEELHTVNEELQHRNREVSQVNDDLLNLLTGASIPIVMVTRDLRVRRFTAEAEKLFNLIPSDGGRPIGDLHPRLNISDLNARLIHVIDTLKPVEFEAHDQDGRWHSVRIRPYETQEHRIDGAVITAIDVDSIKRSEQQLRDSRDFANCILDAVQDSLVVLDADHHIRTANRSFLRTFQFLPDEAVGRPLFDLWGAGTDTDLLRGRLDELSSSGLPVQEFELEHTFATIGRRMLRVNVRPIVFMERKRSLLLAVEDITERRQAEKARHELEVKMFQVQKLESLGVLAGGIAHDLNNLLTPVLGYAEIVREMLPADSSTAPMLQIIEQHAQKAADLIQQILAYAGKGRFVIQPVDLSWLVQGMAGLLAAVLSRKANCRFELAEGLPTIEADLTQMRQVILNLVTNASEALEGAAGSITIRTGTLQADKGTLQSPQKAEDLPAGTYVFLEVADSGCGMTADTITKVFDPFFSTKFTGRGLGLAAVMGIVSGHGGAIQVRSECGKGSTFQVSFPAIPRFADGANSAADGDDGWRGSGTILVIDDESAIRKLAVFFLGQAGFTVLVAEDVEHGVELFRAHADVAAVLLDMTMPGMSGQDAIGALHAIRPTVRIILMSGYTVEDAAGAHARQGVIAFVQKPFSRTTLLAPFRHLSS